MKIINDHLSSVSTSSFPDCNTEDGRTEKKKKSRERQKTKRSALEVREEERHTICSTL